MPVFKNKTQGQYVNVYKDILKNHSLSLRDRGMVVTLLSLPDNWEFTISGLSKIIPDGKSSIRASLSHLEELGQRCNRSFMTLYRYLSKLATYSPHPRA